MTIKSATIEEVMTGKVKRLNRNSAKAAVSKMSCELISKLKAEDEGYEASFKDAKGFIRGAVIGRPKKETKREVVSIRVPSDALAKIKSLGKGWSTKAGDALARMVANGSL